MPITEHPLHGSQRALLTHWALASGDNAKSSQGIRMTDTGRRNPVIDQALHSLPRHIGFLAASPKRPPPEPGHAKTEQRQRRAVHRHAIVLAMPPNHRRQPLAHFRDRVVQALPKEDLHLLQFGLQPLGMVWRNTVNMPFLRFFAQICVKPRKVNVSGLPRPASFLFWAAYGPNSRSRVLSRCNSSPNAAKRLRRSSRNC